MTGFFKPYEGTRPYVFISYSHRQSAEVVDTIRRLHEGGIRLWYDEGIPAGSDWPANIANHMNGCEKVVFFLSKEALASPNCFSEIRTAARLGRPVLTVRLDGSEPEGEWAELLADPPLPVAESPASRADAILRSGFLPRRFRRTRRERINFRALGLAGALALFLGAVSLLGWSLTWRSAPAPPPSPPPTASPAPAPTPVPVVDMGGAERYFAVRFPDSQQETAVRRALAIPSGEIYRWQLAEIPEIYFCGNMTPVRMDKVRFDADGVCRVNGAPVVTGQVADLELISRMLRLEQLALVCQPLDGLDGLSGHPLLHELYLSGSSVKDLRALRDLPGLEKLHLEYTPVRDLTPLSELGALQRVTVSRDMLPLRWDEAAGFRVELVCPPLPDTEGG